MSHGGGGGHHFDWSLGLSCFSAAVGLFTGGFTLGAGPCLVASLLCASSCCFSGTGGFCSSTALRARHVRSITLHPVFWPPGFHVRGWAADAHYGRRADSLLFRYHCNCERCREF